MTRTHQQPGDAPAFSAPCGPIRGRVDGAVVRASGIPYATASRFEPPTASPDHHDVFEATTCAPASPQLPVPFLERRLGYRSADLHQDEHCQRLSVTMPARPSSQPRPVMVWIHGGSYTTGAGDIPIQDPAALVSEQDVVVVTITYRLGMLGYLGGSSDRPANLGLMDQMCALRWVQRNIAAFGGDPADVTVFGESAGGDAVLHLMATSEGPSLFRRAIVQSAPLGISRGRGDMYAAMLAATTDASPTTSLTDLLAMQRAAERAASAFGLRSAMPFGTRYGHDPLPREDNVEAAWADMAPTVDLLIGTNAHEARFFIESVPALARIARIPVIGAASAEFVARVLTDVIYAHPARRFARRYRRAGGTVSRYVVRWRAPHNPLGSAHTIDLPLLFGTPSIWRNAEIVRGADQDEMMSSSRRMRAIWAAFARGEDISQRSTRHLVDVTSLA